MSCQFRELEIVTAWKIGYTIKIISILSVTDEEDLEWKMDLRILTGMEML